MLPFRDDTTGRHRGLRTVAPMPSPTVWSLTPATLARVAVTETAEPTLSLTLDAELFLESHPELSLGIDCCGVCATPEAAMGDALRECARCRAVVYCGVACEALDSTSHAVSCALLGFAGDLTDVSRADPDRVSAAAQAVRSTVANLKLLGATSARAILGPRGYRAGDGDDEGEDGTDKASRDAVKLRWGAVLKLANPLKKKTKGSSSSARAAATLMQHGEHMSYPLSIIAASWMFPIVHYALMIGGGLGQAERFEDEKRGTQQVAPGQVHLVGAAAAAAASADASWWPWLIDFACQLPKPGVEVVCVGVEVVDGTADDETDEKRQGKGKGNADDENDEKKNATAKAIKKSVHKSTYRDFVRRRETTNAPGPYLIFASDLTRSGDCEEILHAARRSAAPFVTAVRTEIDLAVETELFEAAGFEVRPWAFPKSGGTTFTAPR